MRRKHAVISVGVALILAVVIGGGYRLLTHQPGFYRNALSDDLHPEKRRQLAERFVQSTLQLVNELRHEEQWSQEFTEQQVNCWLADELPAKYADWLPA